MQLHKHILFNDFKVFKLTPHIHKLANATDFHCAAHPTPDLTASENKKQHFTQGRAVKPPPPPRFLNKYVSV